MATETLRKACSCEEILRVAINFAGMLLVACKQHMLLLETLKCYESAVVILI